MILFGFDIIPGTPIISARYVADGRCYEQSVWSQAGRDYVRTGSRCTHDLEYHWFSPEQSAALADFEKSGLKEIEFWRGIE